jgi:hypothetical protein
MREMRNAYKVLFRKPKGKRLLQRLRHGWEDDNNNVELIETGHEDVDTIRLAQDRVEWLALVNIVMNLHIK